MPQHEKTNDVMDVIKQELEASLEQSKGNLDQARRELTEFIDSLEEQIDTALVEGSIRALELTRDSIAAKAASTALQAVQRQREVVVATVSSVLRAVIKIALV